MTDHRATEVLDFWFGAGPERGKPHKRWFEKDAAFDAEVTARFLPLYETISTQRRWLEGPANCLARVVVLDQFPRNMFRGEARAFGSDALALETARHVLERGYDRAALAVERL